LRIKRALYLTLTLFYGFILLFSLSIRLLLIWFTVNWKIRRARRSFEREIIKYGVDKKEAKKLSAKYITLKKNLKRLFMQSFKKPSAFHA
jgi:hypothetical protein